MPVLQDRAPFPWTALLIVVILVVPLFDTGFVLVLRRLAGRSATRGGTDHVSHRLVSLGFSERSAVRILYLLGIVGGLTAWALVAGGVEQMLPLAALFAVVVTLVGIYLARVPAYNAQDFKALERSSFAPLLKDLTFRWHAGEVMLDLVLIAACYYLAYRLRFEGEDLDHFLPYFTASLPVVLGLKLASLYGSGSVPTIVGDVRPPRYQPSCCAASRWDRSCRSSRPPTSTAWRASRASSSSSTRCCSRLRSSPRAHRSAA